MAIVYIDTISMELSICILRGHSADLDEMSPYVAFHPSLRCLPVSRMKELILKTFILYLLVMFGIYYKHG